MSTRDTYKIAHTARCKLQMAADSPDRNLRFILGHAFTLDNLRLRIAEIEVGGSSDSDSDAGCDWDPNLAQTKDRGVCTGNAHPPKQGAGTGGPRRVSFQEKSLSWGLNKTTTRRGNRSPPPPPPLDEDPESDDDDDEYVTEDDDEEDLGLVRFGSAAAQPPRISDEEEVKAEVLAGQRAGIEVGQKKYSDSELKALCTGEGDMELAKAYGRIAGCPCHGGKGPHLEKLWELPQAGGSLGPRVAVMSIA
ncbi:hypothetical protein QTJ16_004260 [Diplocarpon rosae]|uniref:Uncharacterized protein n=1 Tax=Diplocarpon rosae TaxID=946125 RepID=A0AAD9WDB3_9HELO|nr:hypothetical protein QTJ16_004260 [Diplocarpon rosae]